MNIAVLNRPVGGGVLLAGWLCTLLALPARADHPSPMPDQISTPQSYVVDYTNDTPGDGNWFPTAQAQVVADALDNDDSSSAGAPNGHHAGFLDLGFATPNFDGEARQALLFDCSDHGGCDSGTAPRNRINLPTNHAMNYPTQAEACVRLVMGHELFHHSQYDYISHAQWSAWGTMPVEGTARAMQDKVYTDLDGDAGCITYRSSISDYFGEPNLRLWDASYASALFWNYAGEQLGEIRSEPSLGVDFIRTFWENAEVDRDDPNTPATLRATIRDYDPSLSLEELFHRFSIANVAREFDVSSVPESSWYRHLDESDGESGAYANVARAWEDELNGSVGPISSDVVELGSRYFEAEVGNDCEGIVGYKAEGDRAGHSLLAINSSGEVQSLHRGRTENFARAFIQRKDEEDRIAKIVTVAAGTDGNADFDFAFACGQPSLDIRLPESDYQSYVGEGDDPERFIVRMVVTGPAVLGTPTVFGLDPSDFDVFVGSASEVNRATVLSGANVQGEYWLVVQAPNKSSNGDFNLTVRFGELAEDTEESAVVYEKRILDQMVVIDRSGSMLSPPGSPKLDAVKNAAPLFIDAASDEDRIGVVSFGGDNAEPNDDSTLESILLPADTANHRSDSKVKIGGITTSPAVLTSIGDGLERARQEFIFRGSSRGEDWIVLLSDGMENEGRFYANVAAALQSDGIKVHTIALGPLSDQPLLQRIATETGGTYYYVEEGSAATASLDIDPSNPADRVERFWALVQGWFGAGPAYAQASGIGGQDGIGPSATLPNRLADVYAAASEVSHNTDRVWEIQSSVPDGGGREHIITVEEEGLSDGRLLFNWDDPKDEMILSVRDPLGATLKNGVDGVQIFVSDSQVAFHLPTVFRGEYLVQIEGVQGFTDYVGILSGRTNFGVNLDVWLAAPILSDPKLTGGLFLWGQPIPIYGALTDSKGPIRGAQMVAEVLHPDGTIAEIPMFDDGANGDGDPNDGIYGALYRRTTEASPTGTGDNPSGPALTGSYNVRVGAFGASELTGEFTRIAKRSFHVIEPRENDADSDGDGMPNPYELSNECLNVGFSDRTLDADDDQLVNEEEWFFGTDPCSADTDFGGESDASEISRGGNPFDPSDDKLPLPEGPEVIDWVPDHFDPLPLNSKTNLIRYPSHSTYQTIRLWRGLSANGPFGVVDEFTPDGSGLYKDDGLTNGTTYYYRLQSLGLSGEESGLSEVFSGTPKDDPSSTTGAVLILGSGFHESPNVQLQLGADAPDTVTMQIGNEPTFAGQPWRPMESTANWTLAPDPTTQVATVFARFRDGANNVSRTYADEAIVVSPGSLGVIKAVAVLSDSASPVGVTLQLVGADLPLGQSSNSGQIVLPDLPAGTYDILASKAGYQSVAIDGVTLGAGGSIDLGVIALPEPGLPAFIAGITALAALRRRRRSGTVLRKA